MSTRSPSTERRNFARASVVSSYGSRRPSIGRLPWHLPALFLAGASAPVGRGFKGG